MHFEPMTGFEPTTFQTPDGSSTYQATGHLLRSYRLVKLVFLIAH